MHTTKQIEVVALPACTSVCLVTTTFGVTLGIGECETISLTIVDEHRVLNIGSDINSCVFGDIC